MKIQKNSKKLTLENMVDSATFFDLALFSSGRIGSKQIKVTVSPKHMYLADRLRESGLFRISTPHMNRGLMILGILADCLYNNLCQKKAINVIRQSKGCRHTHNVETLNTAIAYLDKTNEANQLLYQNYVRYGNSIHGTNIVAYLPMFNLSSTKPHKIKKVVVPVELEKLCMAFSQAPPTDKKYAISKKVKNEKAMIWIPNHIRVIAFALMKSSIVHTRLMSDIYRGGFVTGLYIMSRWVIENRLSVDEYCLCKILHNIYDYLTENK